MGFFATYCGVIYNDFLAIMTSVNNTCYDKNLKREKNCTAYFGIDRVWAGSSNKITYLNSFKMKLSIVLGVTHMMVGILMKGLNSFYFSNYVDFIFEFVPQFLFMSCTFGYMVFCIMIKWLTNWEGKDAPNIINIFINFVTTVSIVD